jgi:hypothetical protein
MGVRGHSRLPGNWRVGNTKAKITLKEQAVALPAVVFEHQMEEAMCASFLFNLSSNLRHRFKNGRCYFFIAAVVSLGSFSSGQVHAQLNISSPSRTDSASTSGPYGSPDSDSFNSITTGTFNDSRSAATSGTSAEPIFGSYYASDSATAGASQTSSISSILLQGMGSSDTSSSLNPDPTMPADKVDATSSSAFSVSFTVSTPQMFALTGTLTGMANYDEGILGILNGNAELTSSGQVTPLYQVTENDTNLPVTLEFSNPTPFSFSTVLDPGQTYTLSVSANTDSGANENNTHADTTSAGFNFTATATDVPEPSSLGILLVTGSLLLRQRRLPHLNSLISTSKR